MSKNYTLEREGQIEFFDNYGIPYNDDASVLVDNTDGVYNGNILEFKLNISNPNKVLFQAIKYLSKMRVKGESIPATILLIDLNNEKVYKYTSSDYKNDIHKIYIGAASKDNTGFVAKKPDEIIDYSKMEGSSKVKKLLKQSKPITETYMPIDIDENCIVGQAERYYRELPKASKGDFLGDDIGTSVKIKGEIREPKHFKNLINPYTGKSNEKFKYLMDCLNDRLSKKDLGAFYTPIAYAKKAAELVQKAVNRALDAGKENYIILDRCAGTGNLESALIGLVDKNGNELIGHSVVSTYEYYEYKVLNERIGDKILDIIPPTEADVIYENGKVSNADAMSEDFINNPIIKKYIDDENCAVILFENPPYRDESSGVVNGVAERSGKKKSYILSQMKAEVKGVATNELANQFIQSGFKYYLRQETDSYIVFSPIKYQKQYSFVNASPVNAYVFNREHFHATPSSILCILQENKIADCKQMNASIYDIQNNSLSFVKKININRVSNPASKHYTIMKFKADDQCKVQCSKDGHEATEKIIRVKSYRNESVIGYLEADSFQIAPHVRNITTACLYNGHGCYLTKEHYLSILPIWVAKHVPLDNWYEKDIYATTADGGDKYKKDDNFLKSCLIYTCLSNQNKCLSFTGSDGRNYQNELCFDADTVASRDLSKMIKKNPLDKEEIALMELWNKILNEAKACSGYNADNHYGVQQITNELNTYTTSGTGKTKKIVYDHPELNGDLDSLRTMLKAYYKSHITEKMFKYELLK